MTMGERKLVVVTGGSGNLGQHTIRELIGAGFVVRNLDRNAPTAEVCPTWPADLTCADAAYTAFKGADAIVHLAAYQAPGIAPDTEVFQNNATASYNVLKVASDLGVHRVVMASSIAAYGFLYAPKMWLPEYLPLDEDHPCSPRDPYALSKIVAEQAASSFVSISDMSVVSLRMTGINFEPDFASLPKRWADPGAKIGTFWSYVDVRDAAIACRLAVTADLVGHHILNIGAKTSRYLEATSDLVETYLPGTRIKGRRRGHWSGLDSSRAKTVLGFEAKYLWQDYIDREGRPLRGR